VVVEQLVTAIREVVAATSLTVLLVEQRADIALDLSTRCMIMDRGNLVFEGESEALREDATRLGQLMGLDAEQPEDPSGRRFLANRH
jgi:branched-chain amino acid transport system ATP-binding protein